MLRVRRSFYDTGARITGTSAIATALGNGTLLPGDQILYGNVSQVLYGTVNAAGDAVVLATC